MSNPVPLARDRQAKRQHLVVGRGGAISGGGHRAPICACVADDDPPPQAETRRPRRREGKGGPCGRTKSWSVYERSAGGFRK